MRAVGLFDFGGGPCQVSGQEMITHPEKILFPDSGITKGDLCSYYEAIAPAAGGTSTPSTSPQMF